MAGKLKVIVKTLSGSTAEALGTFPVPSSARIKADSGTIYIGEAGVTSATGYPVPTSGDGMLLQEVFSSGFTTTIDLTQVYVQGANGNIIRVLYREEA